MKFTFKVVTTPECGEFLKIKAADIDEKISALVDAHKAIFDSITETIADIDYNNHSMKFGGEQ